MSFPKVLQRFRPASGMVTDLPAFEVGPGFYTVGENVQFRNGFAQRASGYAGIYTGMQAAALNLLNVQVGSDNYWIYQGEQEQYAVNGAVHTSIEIAAGISAQLDPNVWTTGLLNGLPVANNGADVPMYWDGNIANKFLALPGWPAGYSCGALVAFRNYLFALDITTAGGSFPDQLLWSNAAAAGAVPTTWTAAATNDAGDAILAETGGSIVNAFPLGASLLFYKDRSVYAADWIGGNNVFAFRKMSEGFGILARHAVAQVAGQHMIMTDSDVLLTNGIDAKSIITDRMRNFLFDQLDQDYYFNSFMVHHRDENEVWICIPTTGSRYADLALVWDTVHNAWGVREMPTVSAAAVGIVNDAAVSNAWDDIVGTWDAQTNIWNSAGFNSAADSLVFAIPDSATPTNTTLQQVESGDTYDGTNIDAYVGKHSIDFGEPERLKMARRLFPRITAAAGALIHCKVGSQMAYTDAITWSGEQTFTAGTTEYLDFLVLGRFLSFEFRSEDAQTWTLSGFDVELERRGYY